MNALQRASTLPLIDTHCHLDIELFDRDRESIVNLCQKKNLTRFILPGVLQDGWSRLSAVTQAYDGFFMAPGLHPCFIAEHRPSHLDELRCVIKQNVEKVVAVGEIGLDHFDKTADRTQQQFYFEQQIHIAAEFNLPLVLHVRRAHDEALKTIRTMGFTGRGVVHCYSGSLQQAGHYLKLGFKLGIGGVITYDNAHRLQAIARSLPLAAFVLETDAPDIPPAGFQGDENTPETLPQVFQAFCRHRLEPREMIMEALFQNTLELFPQLGG